MKKRRHAADGCRAGNDGAMFMSVALRPDQSARVHGETRFARHPISGSRRPRGRRVTVIASVRMTTRRRSLGRLIDVVLGVYLGNDVVDLFLSLGHHLARLLTDLVDTANGRPEQRI